MQLFFDSKDHVDGREEVEFIFPTSLFFSLDRSKVRKSMQSLPRNSSIASRAARPLVTQLRCAMTHRSPQGRKSGSLNARRREKLAIDRRSQPLLTPRYPTSSSFSSPSSCPHPCSLPPAATEFLSAAFGPASPGLQPSLVVNAVVFTLGAKVLSAGLTPPAVAASFLLGTLSFAAFGWRGYLIVCGYFVAGSAVTKLRLAQKEAEGIAEARGGRRAPGSVMGSGLAGALASAAVLVFSANTSITNASFHALCATAFVASFASKLADTASSEVGKAFGTDAYLSTTLEKVPRGTEGAVSVEGSIAGLAAAAAVGAVAVSIAMIPPKAAVAAALAAVAANVFESWLGATVQSGKKNALVNLSNDAVNAIQICVAAALAAAAAKVLSLV